MIVDTSALMAILQKEPERDSFTGALARADKVAISAATLVELALVAESRGGPEARTEVDALLAETTAEIVPFTAEQATLAADGWRRFGKGRHPAGLNLGDCFAYALARHRNEPLLYKGEDFARTDVKAAL